MRGRRFGIAALAATVALVGVVSTDRSAAQRPAGASPASDISGGKIKHIVWIMQENRSFDSYFGTYPGANGIPTDGAGHFLASTCEYDPVQPTQPVCPYHNYNDTNSGGDHSYDASNADVDGGRMDGFQDSARRSFGSAGCSESEPQRCQQLADPMGYHDAREVPNYWTYAENFGLADRAFEFTPSWSLPSHLYMVSEWSGTCKAPDGKWVDDPMGCKYDTVHPSGGTPLQRCAQGIRTEYTCPIFAWTSMTQLLRDGGKTWAYYEFPGSVADCTDSADPAAACAQANSGTSMTSYIWNPLPYFADVKDAGQLGNVQDIANFYPAAANGTLPDVSWVVPSAELSEHASQGLTGKSVHDGQEYVTGLINSIMSGPDWDSTAIFVTWDDWGGFYDHVVPPNSASTRDPIRAGIRVPMVIISPYARRGMINHRTLGLDSINRFIEDVFVDSQRLDPATDGRPDARTVVGETRHWVGDLSNSFNFNQSPRAPLILDPDPLPGPPSCIDRIACDSLYVTDMPVRTMQVNQKVSLAMTVQGAKTGLTVRIDARHKRDVVAATATVGSGGAVTVQINAGLAHPADQYSIVLTNPGGAVASCNLCLTVTS